MFKNLEGVEIFIYTLKRAAVSARSGLSSLKKHLEYDT